MSVSEVSGRSAVGLGPGFDIGWWVPPQPARRRPREEPAVEVSGESRHLVVMRPGQQATQRAPTMNDVGKVLKAWRAAERELNEIRESSPEWLLVHAEIISLRAAYHRLFEERWQLAASY